MPPIDDEFRVMIMNPYMLMVGCASTGWLLVEAFDVCGNSRVQVGMNILGAAAGALISGAFVLLNLTRK